MKNKFRNDFHTLLSSLNLTGNGIEIGVAEGNYSEILINTTQLSKIYLLDIWEPYDPPTPTKPKSDKPYGEMRYKHVLKKMQKYGNRVEVIRGDSTEIYKQFPDNFFDFIYIDANHEYNYIKQDLINWYPKCRKVFAGHDYVNQITSRCLVEVKKAVDEFCDNNNIIPSITLGTTKCPPSWYIIK